jgi:hypothetical protein
VKFVGSGFGRDVDLRSLASKLGGVDPSLDLKFLKSIDRRKLDVEIEIRIEVRNAVQRVIVERAPHTAYGDVLIHAVTTLAAGGYRGGCETVGHVGRQSDQLQKVASIQRKVVNMFFLDNGTNCRAFCRQIRGQGADLDGLRRLPNGQSYIHPGGLLHLNFDCTGRGLKARSANPNLIGGRDQIWKIINSGVVGRGGSRNAGADISSGN